MKTPKSKPLVLFGLSVLVPMLAAKASRRLTRQGYQFITHKEFPKNPANRNTRWRDALIWGALSGMAGGLSRVGAKWMLAESPLPSEDCDLEEFQEEIE